MQEISARKLSREGGRRGTGHVVGVRKGVFPGVLRGGAYRFSSDLLAAGAVSGRGGFVRRLARCPRQSLPAGTGSRPKPPRAATPCRFASMPAL